MIRTVYEVSSSVKWGLFRLLVPILEGASIAHDLVDVLDPGVDIGDSQFIAATIRDLSVDAQKMRQSFVREGVQDVVWNRFDDAHINLHSVSSVPA